MKNKLSNISKPVLALASVAVMGAGFGVAALASAATVPATSTTSTTTQGQNNHRGGMPGVHGKVTAVNGSTLTVTETNPKDSTTTTYTVDATNAKIMKSSATATAPTPGTKPAAPITATLSDIAVGDTVMVRGTVSGTNVTATDIMDGVMGFGGHGMMANHGGDHGKSGTITAVNGSTVTITAKDGTTYSINAASAKLEKISAISVSDLAVGDTINAEGTVSGNSITAMHIIDGAMPQGPGAQASTTTQ